MKAVICTNYGPPEVLQMKEMEKPKPKDHEVLIKVFAATAHIGDTRIRRADPFLVRLVFGMLKPRKNLILGLEISGVIESVGKNVQSFKEGDKVFGLTGFCGGYAEYICLPEKVKNGTGEKRNGCNKAQPFILRRSCGRSIGSTYSFEKFAKSKNQARSENIDQWSIRQPRDVCDSTCEILWGRSHSGVQ